MTALDRLKRFVMQYGSHPRALAPEELRDEVRAELSRASKLRANRKDEKDQ